MEKQKNLTLKQKQVLKFIHHSIKSKRLPPTIREIASQFGYSSTGTVRDYLRALTSKGYIKTHANKSRAIELIREAVFSVPILGSIRAGLPNLAVEEIEDYLNLESLVFSDEGTFALRVKGDSMQDAGIMEGDLVLVKRQSMTQPGETIVALVGEEATVKHLTRKGNQFYLEAANSKYPPMAVTEGVAIIGKVISVVRRLS